MATVTAYTAERMKAIEDSAVVDGEVVVDNLILTRHDGGTIDAGNVRGPTGSPGVTNAELNAWMSDNLPICSIIDYLGIAAPSAKWLGMTGQQVVNGNTLYPEFWSKIPAGMKHANGTTILMPDTRGRVAVNYDPGQTEFDAVAEIGGAKTHILSQAQLPAAQLSIDPPATNVSVNPPATAVTGQSDQWFEQHVHYPQGAVAAGQKFFIVQTPGGPHGLNITSGTGVTIEAKDSTHMQDMTHVHGPGSYQVDIAPFNVSVDIPAFLAPALGSGQAHNNLQPYVVFFKMIKVL